jgi:hypothetical protein
MAGNLFAGTRAGELICIRAARSMPRHGIDRRDARSSLIAALRTTETQRHGPA